MAGMGRGYLFTALAALTVMLALPLQPAPAQDLFGLFGGKDAPAPRRPATGYAISRPGPAGSPFFSPFGGFFSPFLPQSRPEPVEPGYRTLCVRMCDGYYFPISHATSSANLTRDADKCSATCGGDARLFYHASPGGDVETMLDLTGRTYASYPTAFKYRRTLVDGCQCRPQPWTETELARHRAYAAAPPPPTGGPGGAGPDPMHIAGQAKDDAAPAPIDRGTLEADGAGGDVISPKQPARAAPRPRPLPKSAQGWDWLFGGSGTASAPKSPYMGSGAR
jgi:hypothetical protein